MRKNGKRLLSFLLAFLLLCALLPGSIMAADDAEDMEEAETHGELAWEQEEVLDDDGVKESGTEEPLEEEVANHGYRAVYGDLVYSIVDECLYCGEECIDSCQVTWLVLRDGVLFWSKVTEEETDICRMNLSSGGRTVLYHVFCPVECIDIVVDDLYYLHNGEIVKVDVLSGEEETLFLDRSFTGFYISNRGNVINMSRIDSKMGTNDVDIAYEHPDSIAELNENPSLDARNNSIIVYNQSYTEWKNITYGNHNNATKIGGAACGPFALANAITYLTGKTIDPLEICNIAVQYKDRKDNQGTYATLLTKYNDRPENDGYGIEYVNYYPTDQITYQKIISWLQDGYALVGSIKTWYQDKSGNWCEGGHYVSFVDYDAKTGNILMLDSNPVKARATYNDCTAYIDKDMKIVNSFHPRYTKQSYPIILLHGVYLFRAVPQPIATSNSGFWEWDGSTTWPQNRKIKTHRDAGDNSEVVGSYDNQESFFTKALNWVTSLGQQFTNTVQVLGSKAVDGVLWYLLANNTWIKGSDLEAIAEKQADTPAPIQSVITINPTAYPTGSIKKGSFVLKGTISSTCNISTIMAEVVDTSSGAAKLSYTATVNATTYSLQGSKIDNAMKFASLEAGHSYYLKYTVKDITGNSKSWQSDSFTVYIAAPSVSVLPVISAETTAAGQKVRITCSDSSATIHYRVNGGAERTGTSLLEEEFTVAGNYNLTAWTTRSGYTASAEAYGAVSVVRTAVPSISSATYTDGGAYVTLSGTGEIYYTLDGSAPTTRSSRYSGPVYLGGNNTTIKAISMEYGKQISEAAEQTVTLSAPASPAAALCNTESRIASGKVASIQWGAVANATAYDALLYYAGTCIAIQENIRGTTASFVLENAGTYSMTVRAKNFFGSGGESTAVSVEAMAPVTVTVVDHILRDEHMTDALVAEVQARINTNEGANAQLVEGNIVSRQTIEYGSLAARPNTPNKKGFTFAGYSAGWNTPVTSDITVYAEYEINYYTVSFWDSNGNTGLGKPQEVMYTDSAVVPTGFALPTGYTLAGWSVDNSASDCFDYTYVTGNMKLYTSYTWANTDLPAVVEIVSAERSANLESYTVSLRYTTYRSLRARLVVSLYTSGYDNGYGTSRMLYTQTKDIDVGQSALGQTISDSITLNCNKKATTVTAVLLYAENDITGGPISEMAITTSVTYPVNSGYWSNWSGWREVFPFSSSDTLQVEQKTQYRYRDMQTTTAQNASIEGWTRYNMSSAVGGWSDWSSTYIEPFSNEAQLREVNTRWIEPTYKTQYHYYRYWGNGGNCPWTFSAAGHSFFDEIWIDNEMPHSVKVSSGNMLKYYDNVNYGNAGTAYNQYKYWLKCGQYADGGWMDWTRSVQTGGGYTEYQYRDTYYTYYFWRWGDWSPWSDVPYSSSSSRDVASRTLYRYRTWQAQYDPSQDFEQEEPTTTVWRLEGNISGVDTDYSGKRATVLVYRQTNTDPTQEQLEYVDQIVIGSNNSYLIHINPKEELDYQKTGDFIVTLSIEGCERLVNVDVIKAPRPTYTVTFFADGVEVGKLEVPEGGGIDVNSVVIPTKEGYRFVKWNKSLVNIRKNMEVNAVFERLSYPVVFVDHVNETVQVEEVQYGAPVTAWNLDDTDGMTFVNWDGLAQGGEAIVTGTTILTAVWEPKLFSVEFRDFDGATVGSIQQVRFGEAAEPPAAVTVDGIVYDWSTSGEAWWNVGKDMVVYPYVPQAYTLPAPTSNVPTDGEYGLFSIELDSVGEDVTIYYVVNEYLTEYDALAFVDAQASDAELHEYATVLEESVDDVSEDPLFDVLDVIQKYTGPIELWGASTVSAFAVDAEGNISNVTVFDYGYDSLDSVDAGILPNVYDDEPTYNVGDVNGDGVVDALDVTVLARHVAQIEIINDTGLLKAADVNRDGMVSAEDLTKLARYVARIISSLN